MQKKIEIKRIYDEPLTTDGYRVLVDRLWPRGIKKIDAKLDEWDKEIAPTTALRKWFDHKEERFAEFIFKYQLELKPKIEELKRLKKIAKTKKVTLLYGAKNPAINHAKVLLDVINSTL